MATSFGLREEAYVLAAAVGHPCRRTPGSYVPTQVQQNPLARLGLMAGVGIPLLLAFCCIGSLALFVIIGSRGVDPPGVPTPAPTVFPTPVRPPGGAAPAALGVLATALLSRPGAVVVPRVPGARAARRAWRGEGKIKGHPPRPRNGAAPGESAPPTPPIPTNRRGACAAIS